MSEKQPQQESLEVLTGEPAQVAQEAVKFYINARKLHSQIQVCLTLSEGTFNPSELQKLINIIEKKQLTTEQEAKRYEGIPEIQDEVQELNQDYSELRKRVFND